MYHESVFSLRQASTKISEVPAVSAPHSLAKIVKDDVTYLRTDSSLEPALATNEKRYGTVVCQHACSIDPIEAGAEFHEDALNDRPRLAIAFIQLKGWTLVVRLLYFLTCGSFWVLLRWFPLLGIKLMFKPCVMSDASHVLIRTEGGHEYFKAISRPWVSRSVAESLDTWPPVCKSCLALLNCESEREDFEKKSVPNEMSQRKISEFSDGLMNSEQLKLKPGGIDCMMEHSQPREHKNSIGVHLRNSHPLLCNCNIRNPSEKKRTSSESLTFKSSDNGEWAQITLFEFRLVQYYLNFWDNCFEVAQFDSQLSPTLLHQSLGHGLPTEDIYISRYNVFGTILYPKYSIVEMIIDEFTHPFYVFQLLAIVMWIWDDYQQYAYVVLALTLLSSFYDLRNARKKFIECSPILDMLMFFDFGTLVYLEVMIFLDNILAAVLGGSSLYSNENLLSRYSKRIPASSLQPGDLFEVEVGMTIPCDAVLLWGGATVSETVLTGESIPALKVPLPGTTNLNAQKLLDDSRLARKPSSTSTSSSYTSGVTSEGGLSGEDVVTSYKIDQDSHCTLYASTTILSVNQPPRGKRLLALAIRTKFLSRHGRAIRSLLFPSSPRFNFNTQAMRFILWLFLITLLGVATSVITGLIYEFDISIILIRTLDLFTDSIPPALPAVLSIGILVAVTRLRQDSGVECINFGRINLAGQVDTFVFDKTGTLTHPGLEFVGCLSVENVKFPISAPTKGRKNASSGLDCLFPVSRPPRIPTTGINRSNSAHQLATTGSGVSRASPLGRLIFPKTAVSAYRKRMVGQKNESKENVGDNRPRLTSTFLKSTELEYRFIQAVTTCHNLSLIHGQIVGDPLEIQMFSFTQWHLHDSKEELAELKILLANDNQNSDFDEGNEMTHDELMPVLNLYDSGEILPTILKPPGVQLSILQLLRRGYTLNDLRKVREAWDFDARHFRDMDVGEVHPHKENITEKSVIKGELKKYFPRGLSELGIVRRFEFSSSLQRTSVIVRDPLSQELFCFCKGSSEVLSDLCRSTSVPHDFENIVANYTQKGARVIAVAGKPLGRLSGKAVLALSRTEIEEKLNLLGCMVFANRLKPEAHPTIRELSAAKCRCIIATGDNPLTALAVAKECGIIKDAWVSQKEIILGDLYVPRTHLAQSRVGQRSYFVWTKLERLKDPNRSIKKSTNESIDTTRNASEPANVNSVQASELREVLMRRVLEAHRRKQTTLDLRDFLRGKNPQQFQFILTGRAFRKLRMLHEELRLPWFGAPQPSTIKTPHTKTSGPIQLSNNSKYSAAIIPGSLHPNCIKVVSSPSSLPPEPQALRTQSIETVEKVPFRYASPKAVKESPSSTLITCKVEPFVTCTTRSLTSGSRSGSSISKRRRRASVQSQPDLSGLIGRYELEIYDHAVASSIIFGAPQSSNIPPQPKYLSNNFNIPSSYFSSRSSWISASTLGPSLIQQQLSKLQSSQPFGVRRRKPLRTPVGPPRQFVKATPAGVLRLPFPAAKIPRKTKTRSSVCSPSARTPNAAISPERPAKSSNSPNNGPPNKLKHHYIASSKPSRRNPERTVFWAFNDKAQAKGLVGLRVRGILPYLDPPVSPSNFNRILHLIKNPFKMTKCLSNRYDEINSASENDEPSKSKHMYATYKPSLSSRSVVIPVDSEDQNLTECKQSRRWPTYFVDKYSNEDASKVPLLRSAIPWADNDSIQVSKLFAKDIHECDPHNHENSNSRNTRAPSWQVCPYLEAAAPSELRTVREDEVSCIPDHNLNLSSVASLQPLLLADVSYAESEALHHTAASLHFHPDFAFPTRSSYSGPPSIRTPGLAHITAELQSPINIRRQRSSLSNRSSSGTDCINVPQSSTRNMRHGISGTSRLAHKGLIPATNDELMILTVVIARKKKKQEHMKSHQNSNLKQIKKSPRNISLSGNTDSIRSLFPIGSTKPECESLHSTATSSLPQPEDDSTNMNSQETSCFSCSENEKRMFPINVPSPMDKYDAETAEQQSNQTEYELVRISLFEYLLRNSKLYARMAPEDKTCLIASLKSLPGVPAVGMCGDSANDCGALRAADVGVALSNHAASVAAPFRCASVTACIDILREGRASLALAFQMFHFIIFYSLIQYFSVALLYIYGLNFTDYQYAFVDFIIILPLSMTMAHSRARSSLKTELPDVNLLSKCFVGSIGVQISLAASFMCALLISLRFIHSWRPFEATTDAGDSSGPEIASYENTMLFYFTNFQFLILCAISVSRGPWQRELRINASFVIWMSLLILICGGMVVINRPATIILPNETNPSPDPVPVPPIAEIGIVAYTAVRIDQLLYLIILPTFAQALVLGFTALHLVTAFIMDALIVDRWRAAQTTMSKLNRTMDRGPIPSDNSSEIDVFHIL